MLSATHSESLVAYIECQVETLICQKMLEAELILTMSGDLAPRYSIDEKNKDK